MGEGTVVVTLNDVLVALKALREEVQMLRKLVQPVIGGPVLGKPEKDSIPDDELRRKIDDLLSRKPELVPQPWTFPQNPPPWQPPPTWPQPPYVTWYCGPPYGPATA